MEVEVHDVEAHVSGTYLAEQRVHVRSVIVEQTAASVYERGNFLDVLLKEAQSVRVGHHDTCNLVVEQRLEILHVNQSVGLGLDLDYAESADCSAGRIGSVGAVRDDDLGPFDVTAGHMVLTHHHQTGQLTVGACARSEGEVGHTGNGGEYLLHFGIYLQNSLDGLCRLERVYAGEAGHGCDFLVDLRVVLHRTASQRIETRIHAEIHLREVGVVSYHVRFADLRQFRSF